MHVEEIKIRKESIGWSVWSLGTSRLPEGSYFAERLEGRYRTAEGAARAAAEFRLAYSIGPNTRQPDTR